MELILAIVLIWAVITTAMVHEMRNQRDAAFLARAKMRKEVAALTHVNRELHAQLVQFSGWIFGHLHGRGVLTLAKNEEGQEYFQYVVDEITEDSDAN